MTPEKIIDRVKSLANKYDQLAVECKDKSNGLIFGPDWVRLNTKAHVYGEVARELRALLEEQT